MSEAAENSRHPDPDPIARHTLEREIEARLDELSRNHRLYETRVIRPGGRLIRIHSRRRLTRRKQHSGYTPDQLAHQLTRELEAPSLHLEPLANPEAARERLLSFAATVERILLLPELALSDSHLLTHIYAPQRKLLAIYLYPRRFDQPQPVRDEVRPPSASPPRLPLSNAADASDGGLLGKVVRSITSGALDLVPDASDPALHTFLVPHSSLSPREINELQHIHDLYAQAYTLGDASDHPNEPDSTNFRGNSGNPDLPDLPDLL